MKKHHPYNISGMYAVTPNDLDTARLCNNVEAALRGGVKLVQYRNKMADTGLRLMQASALLALCRSFKVPLVINDHLDLCAQIDADGLHLGATDCDLSAARRLLGNDKIIGASCYNQLDLALKAKEAGASYVIFGVSFNSDSAPDALEGPLSEFIEAKQKISIPIVVIGNLTLDNAAQVIKAGATSIALMNGLFNAKNIQDTSQQFAQLFTNH
jgi:thiamine-phosphate pyrophosphorylase